MKDSLLPTLLLVLFIGLKLGGVIDWSWWWVLSPFWIPLCIALLAFVVFLIDRRFESKEARAARMLREYGDALTKR